MRSFQAIKTRLSSTRQPLLAASIRLLSSQIPINGTSRVVRLKVKNEEEAGQAQDVLYRAHQEMKKSGVKGYVGSTRFLCKAEWDMLLYFRFANLESLQGYMGSEAKEKKIEPILKELEKISATPVHSQNFVVDDW